jgi:hypothetical protein
MGMKCKKIGLMAAIMEKVFPGRLYDTRLLSKPVNSKVSPRPTPSILTGIFL